MHPSVKQLLRWLDCSHLPPHLQAVAEPFSKAGVMVATELSGPEAAVSLRKLVEAKDAAVRAKVAEDGREDEIVADMLVKDSRDLADTQVLR